MVLFSATSFGAFLAVRAQSRVVTNVGGNQAKMGKKTKRWDGYLLDDERDTVDESVLLARDGRVFIAQHMTLLVEYLPRM